MSSLEERINSRRNARSKSPGSPRRRASTKKKTLTKEERSLTMSLGWSKQKAPIINIKEKKKPSPKKVRSASSRNSSPKFQTIRRNISRSPSPKKKSRSKKKKKLKTATAPPIFQAQDASHSSILPSPPILRRNKSGKSVWYHILAVAALFALCGAAIALLTPNNNSNDPYAVLEITKPQVLALTNQERLQLFKTKYRALSKKHHPDRVGGSEEAFILLTRSYETLKTSNGVNSEHVNEDGNTEADEDLKKLLLEAKELMTSVLENKLLRCVTIGGVLGLLTGWISKKKSMSGV
tara:strand:- start:1363 stop:2244 length:882 start_codon:yes stop_codon:yes gene_type:complete